MAFTCGAGLPNHHPSGVWSGLVRCNGLLDNAPHLRWRPNLAEFETPATEATSGVQGPMKSLAAIVVSEALLIISCSSLGPSEEDSNPDLGSTDEEMSSGADAGNPDSGSCTWWIEGRPALREGFASSDGCNECGCEFRFQELQFGCLTAFCENGPHRCWSDSDCPNMGFCHFDPGCAADNQGWCAVFGAKPVGPGSGPFFCGCDGTTFQGSIVTGRAVWQSNLHRQTMEDGRSLQVTR